MAHAILTKPIVTIERVTADDGETVDITFVNGEQHDVPPKFLLAMIRDGRARQGPDADSRPQFERIASGGGFIHGKRIDPTVGIIKRVAP